MRPDIKDVTDEVRSLMDASNIGDDTDSVAQGGGKSKQTKGIRTFYMVEVRGVEPLSEMEST